MHNLLVDAVILSTISVLCNGYQHFSNPVVSTPLGIVEGYYTESVGGHIYAAFEGVPYAKAPVGKYRFEEPQPITEPWFGIWQANILHECLQYYHNTEQEKYFVYGNEDCLYVNVYVPKREDNSTLFDVIVFIHGGAFMFNSGAVYGPKIIMDREVIFVTLNYRLGPLGFLSTEDPTLPGNNGIKDQILALKWIKQNINSFGGNPNSITITGMSAGGASVQLHYLSPLSKGLFNRGFSMSGVVLNPWVLVENSAEKAKKLANIVGCPTENNSEMVDCLRLRPAHQIVHAVKHFLYWLYNPFSPFGIVVDKWSSNPVLPEHPYNLLKNKQVQDLPWIASNVQAEGLYPAADSKYLNDINDKWNDIMPFILDYNYTLSCGEKEVVSQRIKEEYINGDNVTKDNFSKFVQLVSDRLFNYDIEKAVSHHAHAVSSPVYFYHFSHRGAHSKSEIRTHSSDNLGASHGDDTVYVLSSNVDTQSTATDRKMSELLLDIWISYAANKLPPHLPRGISWPEVSKNRDQKFDYLLIRSPYKLEIKKGLVNNQNFWKSLPFMENEKLLNVKDEL